MIRVCEVKIDGYEQPFKIKSLTVNEADKFVAESKEMIASRETLADGAWVDRVVKTVRENIITPGEFDPRTELDLSTLNALYLRILEFSGLRAGEDQAAASVSPKSAAA